MIFDTNVVLDIIDGVAGAEFDKVIARLQSKTNVFVNDIVFAEISGRYESANEVLELLGLLALQPARLSLDDCHRAGVAFRTYRREGGPRATILPDFLIGAHAEGRGWPIVTRDRKGFARYFPKVELIDPYKGLS